MARKQFYEDFEKNKLDYQIEYAMLLISDYLESSDINEIYAEIRNEQRFSRPAEKVYSFSNENLHELFRHMDLTDKSVATVGSSGDQAIYSIFKGAKHVTIIDSNILAKPYIDLKIAAIKGLNHREFRKFFGRIDNVLWNADYVWLYKKITHLLPPDSRAFWDTLLLEAANDGDKFKFSRMFYMYTPHEEIPIYEYPEMYKKLQEILLNEDYTIDYVVSELNDFPDRLNGKYDLILLSNIYSYFTSPAEREEEFFKCIEKLFKNNLNDRGLIQLCSSQWKFDLSTFSKKIWDMKGKQVFIENTGMINSEGSVCVQKVNDKLPIK